VLALAANPLQTAGAAIANPYNVTLAWNPNPETDVTSYQLSYGTAPGVHPNLVEAGMNTAVAVSGLLEGTTYYFVVTARNQAGQQSELSTEITYQKSVRSTGTVNVAWDTNPEPNIAGYRVFLGGASGNLAQIQDVGLTTTASLSSLAPATTYYCAVQAYDTLGMASALSGEITFTTPSAAVLFNTWASGSGLSGAIAAPTAMPYNDGVSNLLKYAFNLTASGPDLRVLDVGTGTAGLSAFTLNQSGTQTWFQVDFLRRKNCGLVYVPTLTTDLQTYTTMTAAPTVTDIDAEWERVSIQQPCDLTSTPKLFGRVEVTLP